MPGGDLVSLFFWGRSKTWGVGKGAPGSGHTVVAWECALSPGVPLRPVGGLCQAELGKGRRAGTATSRKGMGFATTGEDWACRLPEAWKPRLVGGLLGWVFSKGRARRSLRHGQGQR